MRAMADWRGEGPVEPGLNDISMGFHLGVDIGNCLLEVVKLDAKVLTPV